MVSLIDIKAGVLNVYGREAALKIGPCLDSIREKRLFAQYHYSESLRVLREVTADCSNELELVHKALSDSKVEEATVFAAAHISACIQNMHSVGDVLARVLYYGLGLEKDKALKPIDIKPYAVKKRLTGVAYELFHELTAHGGYKYIDAVCNTSKHISQVQTHYHIEVAKEKGFDKGLVIDALEYVDFSDKAFTYPATNALEFLVSEYARRDVLTIDLLTYVENDLKQKQASPHIT